MQWSRSRRFLIQCFAGSRKGAKKKIYKVLILCYNYRDRKLVDIFLFRE